MWIQTKKLQESCKYINFIKMLNCFRELQLDNKEERVFLVFCFCFVFLFCFFGGGKMQSDKMSFQSVTEDVDDAVLMSTESSFRF